MATNKTARDGVALAAVIVAFVAVIMANLLADKKFTRADLTNEGRYSLSEPFKSILSKLQDTAKVSYYISDHVPTRFQSEKRDILDKLGEITTFAKGKIELEVIDPSENAELRETLRKEGFEHEVGELSKDQVSVLRIFSGIKITYQNKPKASIPGIGESEMLEYLLGSKLLELTTVKKPIIAVQAPPAPMQNPMMPQRGGPQGSGYEWLQQGGWGEEAQKFEFKSVDLSENNTVPADAALLILIRPKDLKERQRYEVLKYLAGGGKVILIASPFKLSREFGWRAEKMSSGLESYLKELGVTYGDSFIADHSNLALQGLDLQRGRMIRERLPFFVRIVPDNIDQKSVLTRLMPGLVMPFPAEVRLDENALKGKGLTPTVLARTTKQSWSVPYSEMFNPGNYSRYDENTQRFEDSKNVFVMLEGKFPFPYEGRPAPPWNEQPPPGAPPQKPENASVDAKPGRLLLWTAPDAFHEQYIGDQQVGRELQSNVNLIVNIIETCSLGEELVKLRAKRYETRTITSLGGKENDLKRNAIKLLLIAGVPILVIGAALTRTFLRRSAQTRYERKFAQTSGPSSFSP